MIGCADRESYLERFLWGEATAEEVATFESHTSACVSCSEAFAAAVIFDRSMKSTLPAWAAKVPNPRDAILQKITVGSMMDSTPASWKAVRWRAVRFVLLCGLVAMLAVAFEGFMTLTIARKKMQRDITAAEVKAYGGLLSRYQDHHRLLPASGNKNMTGDLATFVRFPFDQSRVVDQQALDTWNEPYVYRAHGESFTLYSKGENRRDEQGQGDDILYVAAAREAGG
ncbi:MAG: hypothetical protein O7H41_03145 [Planctomycetota bacterium]|nr:hypothetical protein [Planctomycetota bacterium]